MKKVIKVFLLILIFCSITGCTYSIDNMILEQKYKSQAKVNVLKLFKRKYNIKPTIKRIVVETTNGFSSLDSDNTSTCYVTLKYKGKTYYALVDAKDENDFGYDDYQYEEIKEDFKKLVSGISDKKITDFKLVYEEKFEFFTNAFLGHGYTNLISTYYNGNNLDEILKDYKFQVLYDSPVTYNEEYLNELFNIYKVKDNYTPIYAFRNKELYQKYKEKDIIEFYHTYYDDYLLDSRITFSDDSTYDIRKNTIKYYLDGIIGVESDNEEANCNITKNSKFNLQEIEGYNADDYEIVSDFYTIKCDIKDALYFYVPIENIDNIKVANKSIYFDGKVESFIDPSPYIIDNRLRIIKSENVNEKNFRLLKKIEK